VVSVHDVSPASAEQTAQWCSDADSLGIPVSLLVIPGPWRGHQLSDEPDYASVLAGSSGWEQRIATWAPTIAVIAKRDQPIVDRFTGLGWRSVYSDDDGSILVAPGR